MHSQCTSASNYTYLCSSKCAQRNSDEKEREIQEEATERRVHKNQHTSERYDTIRFDNAIALQQVIYIKS